MLWAGFSIRPVQCWRNWQTLRNNPCLQGTSEGTYGKLAMRYLKNSCLNLELSFSNYIIVSNWRSCILITLWPAKALWDCFELWFWCHGLSTWLILNDTRFAETEKMKGILSSSYHCSEQMQSGYKGDTGEWTCPATEDDSVDSRKWRLFIFLNL